MTSELCAAGAVVAITAAAPMGRPQQPDDVAGLALYLASPAADDMTGQSINIDGGLMMS